MAVKVLNEICQNTRKKWTSLNQISIHHRLGIVPVGEASVIIAVSSPHRGEGIQAMSSLIDELKAKVPIWKKERYLSSTQWKNNPECYFPPKCC